jgi:hypothetical protein
MNTVFYFDFAITSFKPSIKQDVPKPGFGRGERPGGWVSKIPAFLPGFLQGRAEALPTIKAV